MKHLAALLLAAAVGIPSPLSAQPRVNGYFSLSYLQGQAQSPYSQGSFGDVRGGLLFSGEFSTRFSYLLEFQAKAIGRLEIEQALIGFLTSDAFQVRAGLFLVPFGRYNEAARAFQTQLVEPPLPIGAIYPPSWREIGVITQGKSKTLTYAAYMGNGLAEGQDLKAGQQFGDNNRDKGRGGRLGVRLSSSLDLGFSYYSGKIDDENSRGISMLGADAAWASPDIKISAEYLQARIENPEPYAQGKAEGFYVLGSVRFGSVTPLVSYQKYSYKDPFHGLGWAGGASAIPGIAENRSLWAIGATMALQANIILKAEYDFYKEYDLELKNNVIRVQAAIHF